MLILVHFELTDLVCVGVCKYCVSPLNREHMLFLDIFPLVHLFALVALYLMHSGHKELARSRNSKCKFMFSFHQHVFGEGILPRVSFVFTNDEPT